MGQSPTRDDWHKLLVSFGNAHVADRKAQAKLIAALKEALTFALAMTAPPYQCAFRLFHSPSCTVLPILT
jgi:hypothetical protein